MHRISRLRFGGIGLVLAVLLIGPFYQGLFFPLPMLTAISAITIGFGLWAWGRRQDGLGLGLPGGWAGGFLLTLTLIYVMQFGWAAYARGNLDWVLRTVAAWLAFIMISQENGPRVRKWLAWTLLVSAAAVSFLGILEYGGFFSEYPDLRAFLNIKDNKFRLYSVFQYPNAGGAFILAAWMTSIGMMLEERSSRGHLILGGLSSLLSVALFLTLSRGIIVILPAGLLLLVAGLALRQWFTTAMYAIVTLGIPIAVVLKPLPVAAIAGNWGLSLLWAVIAVAAGVGAVWGANRFIRMSGARNLRIGLIALLLAAVAASGVWFISQPETAARAAGLGRLFDITLETQSAQTRFTFTRDAFRIFMDHPLGTGGFGWDRSYRRYQESAYISRETHNHYAQVLVEAGALGLLALIGGVVTALWTGFRNRHEQPAQWAMVAAGGVFAAHALVDFDLSYPVLWILMWILLAVGQTPSALPIEKERRYVWPISVTAVALLAVLAVDLTVAAYSFRSAGDAAVRKDYDTALKLGERSIKLDPLNSQHLQLVAFEKNLKRATEVDPYNATIWNSLSERLEKEKRLPEATAAAWKALENQPMLIGRYLTVARLVGLSLDKSFLAGEREKALAFAKEMLNLASQLDEQIAVAASHQQGSSSTKLAWTPALHLEVGKALMLTGDLMKAEQHLSQASTDKTIAPTSSLWLHALYTFRGDQGAIQAMKVKPAPAEFLSPTYQALLKWK